MKLSFFGAAQNVTGSKHLVESGGYAFLFDCGLHQGRRREAERLNRRFPINAEKIDSVILSHAHADHCGMLPVLVREGFKGKIYSTHATAEISEFILLDSAKIQEQDSEHLNMHFPEEGTHTPLYTEADVLNCLPHFNPVPYFSLEPKWHNLNDNIRFKLYDAGHILGSSLSLVEVKEEGITKNILYTGDLGHWPAPIIKSPDLVTESVETLIMEATYGSRTHGSIEEVETKLAEIVNEAFNKKGKLIVPAFSLGRTQEIIYILHKLHNEKRIPFLPIYIDSPLSNRISDVFDKHIEDYDEETWIDFGSVGQVPLEFAGLHYISSKEDSVNLNTLEGPLMIISASGMMEGGRIRHHLAHNISNPNNFVLITGYQAANTLGRKIHHGESPVKILNNWYDVNAKVITLNEFSAHADQRQLLDFVTKLKGLKRVFLVHAELPEAESFKELLSKKFPKLEVIIPEFKDSFNI